ncbi:aminopeptidase [Dysosmobacter sp. NSJ-60]|uniref:M18 family aminopeptidase n=1 Tax=Pusillibacter faecalis TaxID=2714358 RepID=A0A810QI04_9FIRM|nr:aminopeptidase [Pusillibacter faecalis]MBC5749007.1 aminopeptidase [Dysosmobacter hominis]MBS5659411.1 aminopeptidase [Oscillibacter sp.]BCK85111.1 M18 family aminopeptidase [Pusillibacter faecalis]
METSEFKALKEKLFSAKKNGYDQLESAELQAMEEYCSNYKAFLDAGKTERLCAAESVRLAEAHGYRRYTRGMPLQPGDKVYVCNRDKAVLLAHIGKQSLAEGAQIAAAHIDSPRLDLKPNPLYEEGEMAYFKTHYYGGIRKYQWVTLPLELHGVVVLCSGERVTVNIGAAPDDPRLVITDLLPHLAQEQSKKPLGEAIPGETLNLLLGSRPIGGEEDSGRVKLAVLKLLNEKYGITEDDFTSAELEAVPALNACDIGLDRSLIGAYGQDDRVCGYAALRALLDLPETPERTAVCVLADKEEIGSDGVTGMQSAAFDTFMEDLCAAQDVPLRACFEKSFCLSTDVTAAYDPDFGDVYEKRNAALINYGVGLCKYTGARGKSGASDADAETVGYVRGLFEQAGVIWQIAELGKVDIGGGGTVAMYMANRNIATLDAGVPVLSMHAPFETVGKLDCWETYKGIRAVYQAKTGIVEK